MSTYSIKKLDDSESEILKTLGEKGEMPAYEISKKLGSKRLATIYEVTKRLKEKSLIKETRGTVKNKKNAKKKPLWLTKNGIAACVMNTDANLDLVISQAKLLKQDDVTISFLEFVKFAKPEIRSETYGKDLLEESNKAWAIMPLVIHNIGKNPKSKQQFLETFSKLYPNKSPLFEFFVAAISEV
jgi:hypothetical protein